MPISFGCSIVSHTFTVAHGACGLAGLGGGGRDERGEGGEEDRASHLPCQNSSRGRKVPVMDT